MQCFPHRPSVVHAVLDNISQVVGHADRNASEQAHFLDLAPGQQYGLRHEYVLDQTLTAAGPRIYSAVVFLDDADQGHGGELWFPDLNIAVAPKAGTLVIYANVKRDDYLAPEPRTRHAHRALADGAPHHVHACVEIKYTLFVQAIDATPARWRGDAASLLLDGASAASSSPRNDLVKNYRVHPPH